LRPISNLRLTIEKLYCSMKSVYYSSKIDNKDGRIVFHYSQMSLVINKSPSAQLIIKGDLNLIPFMNGKDEVFISLSENSKLEILGDFSIGQGVKIHLSPNANLTFGGKDKESNSGITANTLIMVNKKIEIGKDFICAWDCYITDSDWHQINGQSHQKDVSIGNHVWIANNCNILKGTNFGNNCIVASNTKISNKSFEDDVIIGGNPPSVLKTSISWSREITS
jgi:acetyltransferase-like isoleucine patch superfamily enzyme